MRKKFWICLTLLVVIPGLLFTASCAKKTVKSESSVSQIAQQEAQTSDVEKARQEEMTKKRLLDEERLNQQRLREKQLREARLQAERAEAAKRKALMEAAQKERFLKELVLFDYDSSVLTSTSQNRLRNKAEWLNENSKVKVIIEGHCDERGSVEYNLALGERRAEAAKAFLIDLGISPSRLTTISYGKERPFDKGHYEGAWAKNRRAHFVIE